MKVLPLNKTNEISTPFIDSHLDRNAVVALERGVDTTQVVASRQDSSSQLPRTRIPCWPAPPGGTGHRLDQRWGHFLEQGWTVGRLRESSHHPLRSPLKPFPHPVPLTPATFPQPYWYSASTGRYRGAAHQLGPPPECILVSRCSLGQEEYAQ